MVWWQRNLTVALGVFPLLIVGNTAAGETWPMTNARIFAAPVFAYALTPFPDAAPGMRRDDAKHVAGTAAPAATRSSITVSPTSVTGLNLAQSDGSEPTTSENWDFSGSVTGELRVFPDDPEFSGQRNKTFSPSFSAQPELEFQWNDGDDRLTLVPFGRWDAYDEQRTHVDIREANWLHRGNGWDVVAGVDVVFWGTAESRHLVNIINQTDGVEDIDEEDKLGQPMGAANLSLGEWGRVGAFVLPYFRERTFPSSDARLRGPVRIDHDDAEYDSDQEEWHVDFAGRYDNTIGPLDFGLAHFYGTSREPRLLLTVPAPGSPELVPFYDLIHQSSLDAQAAVDGTVLKLEALTRSGQGDRFYAVVGGFEHTVFGVLGTRADVGILAEYLGDSRNPDEAPDTPFEDDVFVGTRLTLNDIQDTRLLAGAVIDVSDQASAISIEAERRIADSFKLEIEGRFFVNVPPLAIGDNPGSAGLSGIRQDGFVQIRLSWFY